MPLTPPGIASTMTAAFAGVAFTGVGIPQLSLAIGTGVTLWTSSTLLVATVDVGTLGVGAGSFPCLIPQPLLMSGMMTGLASNGLAGTASPQLAAALANGLALAFSSQGLIVTAHPTVGIGTATVTFPGPSAIPAMLAGFASAGLTGISVPQMASAVGMGLDIAFASFVLPIPIIGSPSPFPSGGVGTGKIV